MPGIEGAVIQVQESHWNELCWPTNPIAPVLASCSGSSEVAGMRRRERQAHLAARVQDMRQRLQQSEEDRMGTGWSPYLIVLAFTSVLVFLGLKWLFS